MRPTCALCFAFPRSAFWPHVSWFLLYTPSSPQAILQQAALAGSAEAEAPGASPRAAELMEQAKRLATAYGVSPWDLELHFTSALITAGGAVTPEVRDTSWSRSALRQSVQADT